MKNIRYLICSTKRVGGTLLLSLLGNRGIVSGERLKEVRINEAKIDWDKKDLNEFMEEIFSSTTTFNGLSGFNIHWQHLEHLVRVLHNTTRHEHVSVWNIASCFPPRVKYIYLTRKDKVRQAISLLKAEQTGIWRMENGANRESSRDPVFDLNYISKFMVELKRQERSWEKFFRKNKISPLRLEYEEYIKDTRETLVKILKHLEMPIPEKLAVTTNLLKQSDALSEEWVRKYYAIGSQRRTSFLFYIYQSVAGEMMQSVYRVSAKLKKRYRFYDQLIRELKTFSNRARHACFRQRNGKFDSAYPVR